MVEYYDLVVFPPFWCFTILMPHLQTSVISLQCQGSANSAFIHKLMILGYYKNFWVRVEPFKYCYCANCYETHHSCISFVFIRSEFIAFVYSHSTLPKIWNYTLEKGAIYKDDTYTSAVYRIPVYRNTGISYTILYRYVSKCCIRYVPYLLFLKVKSVLENSC